MTKKNRVHVFVSGLVQRVFFRENTRQVATTLELFGWIKNLPDGRVEAIFEGEKEKIEEILEWLRKGPRRARVDDIETQWEDFKGEFEKFEVRHD